MKDNIKRSSMFTSVIQIGIEIAVIMGIIFGNSFILNVFRGVTCVVFISYIINIFYIIAAPIGEAKTKFIKNAVAKRITSKSIEYILWTFNIFVVVFLFGYTYWYLGAMWVLIHLMHYVFQDYIDIAHNSIISIREGV